MSSRASPARWTRRPPSPRERRLPPPDGLRGPVPATVPEIDRINRVFSDAFTDRYLRDGMRGVRVPLPNPAIWRFAIGDASDGGGAGGGPRAVRPDRRGGGLGAAIVPRAIAGLEERGARTIGLETMPRTIDNIGFYSRLGFRPGHLTVSMTRDIEAAPARRGERPSRGDRESGLRACRALTAELSPGVDFSRELLLTLEHGLGDVTLLARDRGLAGFALWHSVPLAEGRPRDEARVLKLVARDLETFRCLVSAVEADVAGQRARRLAIRCQTAYPKAFGALVDAGYRVHWTDLRMTLEGKAERHALGEGVVFSNWEI